MIGHSPLIHSIQFSLVAGARHDYQNPVQDNFSEAKTLIGHSGWIRSVAISPDGQTLVSVSEDKTIKLWNLNTGQLLRTLTGHSDKVTSVAISPDGQTLVSGSLDKKIKLWNLNTGQRLRTLDVRTSQGLIVQVSAIAFSADGQTLVSGDETGTLKIWRLAKP